MKHFRSIVLLLLLMTVLATTAWADTTVEQGDFSITHGDTITDVPTYRDSALIINESGTYTIGMKTPGTTTTDRILIGDPNDPPATGIDVTLVFNDVKIDPNSDGCLIDGTTDSTLTIQGTLTAKTVTCAAIQMNGDLTISGEDTVVIAESAGNIGIFGTNNIIITDANVTSTTINSDNQNEAIISGSGTVTISGTADVTATANGTGNAISVNEGKIDISGTANVTATAKGTGNAIYAKSKSAISGGTVTAESTSGNAIATGSNMGVTVSGTANIVAKAPNGFAIVTGNMMPTTTGLIVKASKDNGVTYTEEVSWSPSDHTYIYGSPFEAAQYISIAPPSTDFTVSSTVTDGYTQTTNVLTITKGGTYDIGLKDTLESPANDSNGTPMDPATTTDRIVIHKDIVDDVTLIFHDVCIATDTAKNAISYDGVDPSNTPVTLTIQGTLTATGGYGIYVNGTLSVAGDTTSVKATGATQAILTGTATEPTTLGVVAEVDGKFSTPTWDDTSNTYKVDDTIAPTVYIGKDLPGLASSSTGSGTPRKYSSEIADTEHGTVSLSDTENYLSDTVTITPTPDKGYNVDSVTVTYASGREVTVTDMDDGTYIYNQPGATVTVTVIFVEIGGGKTEDNLPFTDVDQDDWFYENVKFAYENGLMNGTSETAFEPMLGTTRGMIITIFHRLESTPETSVANIFNDVYHGMFYTDAVAWGEEHDIILGYGDGTYGPNDNITREQLAAIFYRYAQYKDMDVSVGENTNILSYYDAFDIAEYAIPAMQWACGEGLITGKPDGILDPTGLATRCEVSMMLMSFLELNK